MWDELADRMFQITNFYRNSDTLKIKIKNIIKQKKPTGIIYYILL